MGYTAKDVTEEQRIEYVRQWLEYEGRQWEFVEDKPFSARTLTQWTNKFKHLFQENYNPHVPDGHYLKGVSKLLDGDGNTKQQWVKTDVSKQEAERHYRDFIKGLGDDLPKATPVKEKIKGHDDDLMAFYILTDAHIGMRSDEWSLDIAEKTVMAWIESASNQTPDAHTAVLNIQGDTAHWDSLAPVTPANRHVLDADCESRQMARVIIKLVRYCIKVLLEKHKHVHVIYQIGNHDEYGAVMNSEWMAVHYEDEPRVTVCLEQSVYHMFEWGKTVIFTHHGHKRSLNDISKVFVGMYPEEFGRAGRDGYRYAHVGHFHHSKVQEDQLMTLEVHPTIAGKDAYARDGGWISKRGANTIIYHKDHGEVGRVTIRPAQLNIKNLNDKKDKGS